MKHIDWLAMPVAFALFVAGCASGGASKQDAIEAHSAVRAAEEVGAEGHPDAALHLKLAKEQIAKAEKLIRDDEGKRAERLLERAQADADLAIALAKADQERHEAERAKERVRELQQPR